MTENKNTAVEPVEAIYQRNTLGVNPHVYVQLLKKLNDPDKMVKPKKTLRTYTRLEYQDPYLELFLQTIDRSKRTITVAARNISCSGISVLHSSYVYPGTFATTKLHKVDGTPMTVSGRVIRCEHRGGIVHEIGIKFDVDIHVREFVRQDIHDSVRVLEKIQPAQLMGKVCIVGDDREVLPDTQVFLKATQLTCEYFKTAEQCLKAKLDNHLLLIACLDVGEMTGPEFTKHLREQGFLKPIILVGSDADKTVKNHIRLSTADGFVVSPIEEEDLLCTLGEYLLSKWSEKQLECARIKPTTEAQQELRNEIAKLGIQLDQHMRTKDAVQVYGTCTKIRSAAPLLGMKSLRDLASKVGEALAGEGELEPQLNTLNDIRLICASVKKAA